MNIYIIPTAAIPQFRIYIELIAALDAPPDRFRRLDIHFVLHDVIGGRKQAIERTDGIRYDVYCQLEYIWR